MENSSPVASSKKGEALALPHRMSLPGRDYRDAGLGRLVFHQERVSRLRQQQSSGSFGKSRSGGQSRVPLQALSDPVSHLTPDPPWLQPRSWAPWPGCPSAQHCTLLRTSRARVSVAVRLCDDVCLTITSYSHCGNDSSHLIRCSLAHSYLTESCPTL